MPIPTTADGGGGRVPPGAEGLLFLPYWPASVRRTWTRMRAAAWIGLRLAHERRHMVRAVLEGVGFALKDSVERMGGLGVAADPLYAVGGGARSAGLARDRWRRARVRLQRLAAEEGPAMGAAILAMVGAGLYPDVGAAVAATVRPAGAPEAARTGARGQRTRRCTGAFGLRSTRRSPDRRLARRLIAGDRAARSGLCPCARLA